MSSSVIARQSRGPTCMLGKSTSACSASMSCSRKRCSGGPTPAVSSTVTPKGSQVSLVRPALRSRNGAGYGGWPSTRRASPPSGSLIVRGARSRYLAGIRGDQRSGRTSRWPSLEIRGGRAGAVMTGSPFLRGWYPMRAWCAPQAVGGLGPRRPRRDYELRRTSHGRDPGPRRDALSPSLRTGRRHGAHPQARPPGPRPSRALPAPGRMARGDARGVRRRRRARRGPAPPGGVDRGLPGDTAAPRRFRPGPRADLGRRPVRELQGRHHPALLRAGVRVDRAPAVGGSAVEKIWERVGRGERRDLRVQGAPRRRQVARLWPARPRLRRVVRVPAVASPAGSRLHEHAAVPGLRSAGLPLPGRAVLDQLLWPPGHLAVRRRRELRRSPDRGSARPAVAGAEALLRPRPRRRARDGRESLAGGPDHLVELVARVPDPEAPPALPRSRRRSRALRQAAGRGLRGVAGDVAAGARGERPAGDAELDVPGGRDGGARPAAGRGEVRPDVPLQLEQVLRGLQRVNAGLTADHVALRVAQPTNQLVLTSTQPTPRGRVRFTVAH